MAFEHPGEGALDYCPCQYGGSKLLFRGPKRALDGDYIAFFGATETYGRFIETPFPSLVGRALGRTSVNLGCMNGGIDVYLNDPALLDIAAGAQVTVIQIMGAHNLSNHYYTVHPRRNDRFIGPSEQMKKTFPEIDFTDFAFTRHLMSALQAHCPRRFDLLVEELQEAWVARMRQLMAGFAGPKVLLWLSDRSPEDTPKWRSGYEHDPLFVDRAMLDAVERAAAATIEVVYDPAQRSTTRDGMVFSELEAPVAAETPGKEIHDAAAKALSRTLADLFA